MIGPAAESQWHRSSRCVNGNCVEITKVGDRYLIRDSKNPQVTPLDFSADEWTAFVAGIKADEFDF